MSKHFDRVNNRTRAIQVNNYADNRPVVYQMQEPMPMDNGGDSQGYDSLLGYWHILVRNKVTLLCFALAGLAVAILFSLVQTPVYRARTSMEIQDFNSDFMGSKEIDPTQSNQNSSTDSYFQTQIKILQSDSLLERVVNKMNTEEERPESGWGAFSAKIQHMLGLGDGRDGAARGGRWLPRGAARRPPARPCAGTATGDCGRRCHRRGAST